MPLPITGMSDERTRDDSKKKLGIPYLLNTSRATGEPSSGHRHRGPPPPPPPLPVPPPPPTLPTPHPSSMQGQHSSGSGAPQPFPPGGHLSGYQPSSQHPVFSTGAPPPPSGRGGGQPRRRTSPTSSGAPSSLADSSSDQPRRKRADPTLPGNDPDAEKRRYVCDRPGCGYRFKQRGDLMKHIRVRHDGERNYRCPACDKTFGERGNLNKHYSSVHEKKRPFACDKCTARYASADSLRRHKRTHEVEQDFSRRAGGSSSSSPYRSGDSSGKRPRYP